MVLSDDGILNYGGYYLLAFFDVSNPSNIIRKDSDQYYGNHRYSTH